MQQYIQNLQFWNFLFFFFFPRGNQIFIRQKTYFLNVAQTDKYSKLTLQITIK